MSDDIIESNFPEPGQAVAGGQPHAWRAETRELLRLGIPLAVTQVAQMAVLATDTLMLGHYSQSALAAAALGNTLYFFAWLVGCGPAAAVSPMISHLRGAARHDAESGAVVAMGCWAVVMLALPLMAMLTVAAPILTAIGEAPDLSAEAGRYAGVLCLGLPFALLYMVLRNFATALGHTRAAMVVMLLSIVWNAVGDYVLIFGDFGFPRMGIIGAGIASASCNLFSCVTLAVILAPMSELKALPARLLKKDGPKLAELFRLGIPISITMIFEIMLFNASTLVMGWFGTAAIAAHQVALTIPSLTFMVPLGLGMAATVRVGMAAGAGDGRAARRAGFVALAISSLFMMGTAVLLLLFPAQIAGAWFSSRSVDPQVIGLAVLFLHVAAAFQIADGLQVTAAMALRGLKDARAPMWIAGGSYWLAGAPASLLLGFVFHMQGLGIWLGLALGLFIAAAALVARFAILSARQIHHHA